MTAQVVSGTAADVALVMRRNANANVSVDFPDEGVPSVATTTTLATEVNPAVTGQRILLRAAVFAASGSARPTGSVRLRDRGVELLTAPLDFGAVVFTISAISFGDHQYTADYLPTGAFLPSSSPILIQPVVAAATRIGLAYPSPAVEINGVVFVPRGVEVTLAASVTVLPPGTKPGPQGPAAS